MMDVSSSSPHVSDVTLIGQLVEILITRQWYKRTNQTDSISVLIWNGITSCLSTRASDICLKTTYDLVTLKTW